MDATCDDAIPSGEVARQPATKIRRTYGRKKEVNDPQPSGGPRGTSSSRYEALTVEPRGSYEDSAASDVPHEEAGDESGFFGWKKKMAAIDKMFDEDETSVKTKPSREAVSRKSNSSQSTSTDDSLSRVDDSLLFGSLPPLTSSSQTDLSTPPKTTHKLKRRSILENNESDAEQVSNDKESSPTSPLHPHPITTPGIKSSPTPPSSDEELELPGPSKLPSLRRSPAEHQNIGRSSLKGKRKADGSNPRDLTKKLKKLNKKEEKESKKAHARIINEQHVSVNKKSEQLSINDFLGKIRQPGNTHATKPTRTNNGTSSDPIQDFTSSPSLLQPAVDPSAEFKMGRVSSLLLDDGDEELPDIHDILREGEARKRGKEVDEQRKKGLALMKQRFLAKTNKLSDSDSDDDDLEVVHERHDQKRSGRAFDYEKKIAGVAGFRPNGGRHSLPVNLEGSQGERALKAAAKTTFVDQHSRRAGAVVDHRALQAAMLNKASKQSAELTREKEDEWVRRGGRLPGRQRASIAKEGLSLKTLAEKLTRKTSGEMAPSTAEDEGHSGDDSDLEWRPESAERRSVGPSEDASGDEEELSGTEIHDENLLPPHEADEEENDENAQSMPRRVSHLPRRLVLSDSEDEDNRRPAPTRVLVPDTSIIMSTEEYIREQALAHRGSISSICESTPDEENKENDNRLMFDHSEDKENLSVPRHVPIAGSSRGFGIQRSTSGLFDLDDRPQRLSMSPINASGNADSKKERKPLQARKCSELDDPFLLQSPTTLSDRGTPKRSPKQYRSPPMSASPKALAPAFGGSSRGFSQLFNDEEGIPPHSRASTQKAFLQPAFQIRGKPSDSPTQDSFALKPMDVGGFSQMFSPEPVVEGKNNFKRPKDMEELSLTFDTRLQPAIEVSTQVRRKADAIFEKEQAFVLEEAALSKVQQKQKTELYVTDSGMLTQTKPDGSTPVVYRAWSPTQGPVGVPSQANDLPSTSQRMPLRTLSLTSEALSPSQPHRLSRLVKGKGRARSPSGSDDEDAVALPHPKNAFVELLKAAEKQQTKKRIHRSEFVEGEAEESDEDEMFGFGGPKKKDDEESDSDDLDANVEGLLDDTKIDDDQLGEDKVFQKVQEQNEQDDAALQKYHQDAVDGKFRSKKRGNGIVLDDSDSDPDEDDDARRIRQRMYKKRRIDDQLEALSNDPKSRAFLDAYKRDVEEDDNDDFAHLTKDDMDSEDDDENQQPETVSTTEIQAQLREAARQKTVKTSRPFDPGDVQWTTSMASSDDEELGVEEVEMRPHKSIKRRSAGAFADFDLLPKESNNWNSEQLAAWKREQSGRNFGTGGMRGAVTVTGHGLKAERKAAAHTSKFATEEKPGRRNVTKAGSMLMKVSDKQSRFG